MRNRTLDLRIPRTDALPLSHRDSTVSKVNYEVHPLTLEDILEDIPLWKIYQLTKTSKSHEVSNVICMEWSR